MNKGYFPIITYHFLFDESTGDIMGCLRYKVYSFEFPHLFQD